MTDRDQGEKPDPSALLQDWVTIWQSELAALASDRESHEALQRIVDEWAAQACAALARLTQPGTTPADRQAALDAASGSAGAAPAAGAAPVAAAPGGRDDLVRDLLGRVAELERRLAKLERG